MLCRYMANSLDATVVKYSSSSGLPQFTAIITGVADDSVFNTVRVILNAVSWELLAVRLVGAQYGLWDWSIIPHDHVASTLQPVAVLLCVWHLQCATLAEGCSHRLVHP
jgi:hypothetical protein